MHILQRSCTNPAFHSCMDISQGVTLKRLTYMIAFIARHELRRQFRDGKSRALLGSVFFILIASIILSVRDFQLTRIQYEENLEQVRLNWEQQSEKDPHDAAHDGTYVIKPLHPLSLFDKGIHPFSGSIVHLGAHQRKQSTINEAKDQSGVFRFGELTPSFALTYLIPLLLIFLGFNTFTDEKERQTLRLNLVQGASKKELILGKWLALLIQMAAVWLFLFAVILVSILFVRSDVQPSVMEVFSLSGTYLFYFIIFINCTIWVSAHSSSSGVSLTILITIWLFFTLIVPKVATNLAGRTYPFPTLQTFKENIVQDQINGLNGHNFWNEAAQDFQQQILEQYGVETIEELPIAYEGLLLAEGEKYESEVYTKHFDLLQNQYRKQRYVYRLSGLFSPMLPVRFVSMSVARTDYGFLWHFEDEAEKYRVDFNTVLNMNIAENAKGVEHYKAGKELWSSIPEFDYQWRRGSEIIRDHLIEFSVILFWAIVSFLLMIFLSQKIKVV